MARIDTIVDWILTERCNLNCYYCLQNADTRKEECGPVDYSFISGLDDTVLFHLTGGEPFLVPNIIDLCNGLQEGGHFVSMNTNMTLPVGRFAENVRSGNFLFINASVHYPYRKHHMDPFMRHFRQLRDKGFFVYATVVMIPAEFDEIVEFIKEYQHQGLILLPKLMRGIELGRRYPASYSETQNEIMKQLVASAIDNMTAAEKEKFQIACENNVSIDNWWEFDSKSRCGTRCFDGTRYVRITERGDIVYCDGKVLGNVKETGFKKLDQACQCRYYDKALCTNKSIY